MSLSQKYSFSKEIKSTFHYFKTTLTSKKSFYHQFENRKALTTSHSLGARKNLLQKYIYKCLRKWNVSLVRSITIEYLSFSEVLSS